MSVEDMLTYLEERLTLLKTTHEHSVLVHKGTYKTKELVFAESIKLLLEDLKRRQDEAADWERILAKYNNGIGYQAPNTSE